MYKIKNKEAGITIIALVVIIIVLLIIAGIAINEGIDILKDSKMQTLQTNMLTIKAKAKEYAEEVEAETWESSGEDKTSKNNEIFQSKYSMKAVGSIDSEIESQINKEITEYNAYELTAETLGGMGLVTLKEDIEDGQKYIVVYDENDYNIIDIIYTGGITYGKGSSKQRCYTLSKIQEIYNN